MPKQLKMSNNRCHYTVAGSKWHAYFRFNNCFGVLGVLDRIHGTDAAFRQTRAYLRHIMMLSFIPPRVAIPDTQLTKMKYWKMQHDLKQQ